MKTKFTIFTVLFLTTFLALSFKETKRVHTYISQKSLCDAPLISAGWTGAPGDGTCANSGCHTGGINNGPGMPSMQIGNGDNIYSPGETYTISLGLTQDLIDKFGFQITNRRTDLDQFTGENILTDPSRTRLINGGMYVGTNSCGSDSDPEGEILWEFDWTAPSNDQGEIVFYTNFIATNHNHSGSGDNVYSMEMTLSPDNLSSIIKQDENSLAIFPNPVQQEIRLITVCGSALIDYEVFEISGRLIMSGSTDCIVNVAHLSTGSYIIQTKIKDKINSQKFFKSNDE